MLDPSSLVSVIISNYNYAQFVGQAIESALALNWPRVEVIVVDDGSTDDSRAVIARYARRVRVVLQQNTGNAGAYQTGFQKSHGSVVIFLDADDCLDPRLVRAVAPVWCDKVSKVQVQMKTIDKDGNDLGTVLPQYFRVPSPQEVRGWVLTSGAYPTPPGSGNVYSRSFLLRVIQFDLCIDRAADSFLLAAAPLLGNVVTVPEPLVSYRIHGQNMGAMLRVEGVRMATDYERSRRRFEYMQAIARGAGFELPDVAFHRSLQVLTYRTASWRLAPAGHPVARESALAIISDAVRAARVGQGHSGAARVVLVIWIVLVCVVPRATAVRVVNWRFVPSSRPPIMKRIMNALGIARVSSARLSGSQS